jgi:hypothetical protein
MSAERLAGRIGKAASRRKFLARAGATALTAAFAVLGLQRPAHAQAPEGPALVTYACCHLCYHPGSPPCRLARCGWSWTCCLNHQLWRCMERYDSQPCSGCESAMCSTANVVGSC